MTVVLILRNKGIAHFVMVQSMSAFCGRHTWSQEKTGRPAVHARERAQCAELSGVNATGKSTAASAAEE